MISLISIRRQNRFLLHKLVNVFFFVVLSVFLITCNSANNVNDKVNAFKSRFPDGMLRFQVEQELLTEKQPLEIVQVAQTKDGTIIVEYRVDKSKWGSSTFFFRFSLNNELIVVWTLPNEY